MQGKQPAQRELFSTIDLETFVPDDHLLRKIDSKIDFDFLYRLTEELYCTDNGRPSIDPVLFFRVQLIGYLYDISSDRQLCREIHLNLAYRWFCRLPLQTDVPHHSSLTRIRDRLGTENYQQIFDHLLKQWRKEKLVKGERVIADATLIAADASMDSLVEREDGDPDARELTAYNKRYYDFQHGRRKRRVANQTHVSRTDHDATMVYRKGSVGGLKYKVHYCADAESRIITDCYTTTGARQEGPLLPDRVAHLCDGLDFNVKEIIADRGYGRGPTYAAFRKRKIRTYIPVHNARMGKGKLTPSSFSYDTRTDRYICPEGHYLYPYSKLEKGVMKRYRITGGHCRNCRLRDQCLPETAKHRARYVYRSPHQSEIDQVRRRQDTATFIGRMIERKWKIEGLFAEAKQYHCLRRARYRGLEKVSIQALMTAIAQNIKRVCNSRLVRLIFFVGKFSLRLKILPLRQRLIEIGQTVLIRHQIQCQLC